ncbi:Uncharacterised protein [Bordetella pertussis]|nr:Uncharacterised protein [Bordetella pertussis]
MLGTKTPVYTGRPAAFQPGCPPCSTATLW